MVINLGKFMIETTLTNYIYTAYYHLMSLKHFCEANFSPMLSAFVHSRKKIAATIIIYSIGFTSSNSYSYVEFRAAVSRWFMVMNYFVHSFMYTYYTLRAMKVHVPKPVAMLITTMQIAQVTLC